MTLETKIREAFERHAQDTRPRSEAWTGVETKIRRSHRRRTIVSGLASAAVIAAIALVAPRLVTNNPPPIGPGPTIAPTNPPRVTAKVPLRAYALAVGPDAIWALVHPDDEGQPDQLKRIDPATNVVDPTNYLSFHPPGMSAARALAADAGGLWVTTTNDDLVHVALPFVENRGPTAYGIDDPRDVALGFGSVWVTSLDAGVRRVLRITPGEAEATITIQDRGSVDEDAYIAFDFDSVWVSFTREGADDAGSVYRINPRTNEITSDLVGQGPPGHIAVGFDSIWLTDQAPMSASALYRVPIANFPETLGDQIVLPDAAPVGLQAITTGAGYVWATSGRGYLWKVDPRTNAPAGEPTLIGDAPPVSADDVVYGFGSVWVASGDGQIWRLTP